MRFHCDVAHRVHHKGGAGSRHLLPRKPVGIVIGVRGRGGVANLLRLAARRIVGVHDGNRIRSAYTLDERGGPSDQNSARKTMATQHQLI